MRLLLVIAISISVVFSMSHTTSGLVELPQDGKHKQIAFNGYAFQLLYPKQNGSCTWRCSAQCGLLLNTTVDCDGAVQFESFGNKTDVQILTKQNDKKNVNPVEGDKNVVVQKQQKLWSKQGNRKCYLGKITKLEIYAYNGLCLRIIMLSLETQDASMIRKTLFEKTRCGAMDRVRCSFE
eukprot:957927_1